MECHSYLRNVTDLLSGRPMKDVLGNNLKDIIPFGSLTEYHFITAKDQSRINQFGKNVYLDCSSDTLCTRREFGKVAC